jgi:hypothetical protein
MGFGVVNFGLLNQYFQFGMADRSVPKLNPNTELTWNIIECKPEMLQLNFGKPTK